MKTTILKLIISGAMLISLSSCETLTFGRKTVAKIKNGCSEQDKINNT